MTQEAAKSREGDLIPMGCLIDRNIALKMHHTRLT